MTDPGLIFCDEPTTGLDSFNALSVVEALQTLTQRNQRKPNNSIEMEVIASNNELDQPILNKAVICSIHQPPSNVFECFSHVILMNGGKIAFQGSVEEAQSFFTSIGYSCPPSYNPAEFYVKMISERSTQINVAQMKQSSYKKQMAMHSKFLNYYKSTGYLRPKPQSSL